MMPGARLAPAGPRDACHSHPTWCAPTASLNDLYYPEMFSGVLISNAPPLFTLVWRFVRNFLSPELQAHVKILSPAETAAALQSVAAADEIPAAVAGGAGKCRTMPAKVAAALGFAQLDRASFDSLLIRQSADRGGCPASTYAIANESK